eukprot:CAMPEP_0114353932 /NCGR_PEP_ID=MMETSP0101-20121206/19036_1 /TAXON_ID=38822 ORGANISM="Pteridomonas danica, Strain PT" /NCGR_SAMPLE_ID=MMETSP0101 /ASSEMBLY_ACC=CAM_ASM_000211 /LENGTH=210 /DNA_ID=CAMNT_0001495019 /DNA_START=82 /DNA_END=711 /DNA_ORIENTATION=-
MTQVQSPLKPFGKRLSTDFCDHEHQPLSSHMIQKRRRYQDENLSPEPENVIEDNEDIFRQKRCRQPDGGSFNVPRYTQQQMDEYEQSKNQEVERMREEMQEYINQKDQEVAAANDEVVMLRSQIEQGKGELSRLTQENTVLKHGIRIQQGQVENAQAECEAKYAQERESFIKISTDAAEHIRRIEAANYSLRVQLEQMVPSNDMPSTPRW